MLYTTVTIGEVDYKCRLNARGLIDLEGILHCNPLNVFMSVSENELPKIAEMIAVFYISLQPYNNGITLEKTYDLYDAYIEEGNSFTDFVELIMNIYKTSGLIKEATEETKN